MTDGTTGATAGATTAPSGNWLLSPAVVGTMNDAKLRHRGVAVLAAGLLLTLVLAACGSSSSTGTQPTTSATTSPTTSQQAAVTVRDADKGRTVTVRVGSVIHLQLASTYWQIVGPDRGGVLTATGAPVQQAGHCPPGIGCGTVTTTYKAVAPGTVHLQASRETCGEALQCQPPTNRYTVTVQVTA